MNWPKVLIVALLISGACLARTGLQVSEQTRVGRSDTLGGKLLARVDRFEGAGKPATELLLDLAYKNHLPMAIEYVDRQVATRKIKVALGGKTVGQALATIVATMPGYTLSTSQGLVDVYSLHAREDPSNALNFVVKNYNVDGVDTHQASAELSCAMARQMRPPRGCFVSMAAGQWGALKVTLHIRDSKVYQILNRIVAQNGSAVWTVLASPDQLSSLGRSPWYIYPLDPAFKQTAIDRLRVLFPSGER